MEGKRKQLIITVLSVMLLALIGIAGYYWYENVNFVSTDDAKVNGDMVKISPQASGKIAELNFDEGQTVVENQIIGRLDAANTTDAAVEFSFIRSPISGMIIKKQGNIGEIAAAGQTLAYVVDPAKLYITANIEETKLNSLKMGEKVDISVDQFGSAKFAGTVKSIGEAASAAFSLLPSTASGSYTKVVQKIPVKIAIDGGSNGLLAGTNAYVKIHIR